ncbi:hypothetical protein CP987_19345, partial [Morganella morganii]
MTCPPSRKAQWKCAKRRNVRVYQRIRETPVSESVTLREEHVRVERHPVDQP